jgi:hypothetical protein
MRMTSRTTAAVGAIALVALLAACGGGSSEAEQSPEPGALASTGETVGVEPLAVPSGSSEVTFEGVTIAVPDDWESTEREVDGTTRVLSVGAAGEERPAVNLTVTTEDGVTDDGVDAEAQTAATQLDATGLVSDLEGLPVQWASVPYAVATRGTLAVDSGDRDLLLITLRDEAGSLVATIWAEAPEGELEGSAAYDVLRTLRIA